MRWTDAPTRRELSLILFSLVIFSLSYNLGTFFFLPEAASRRTTAYGVGLLNDFGFNVGGRNEIGPDGRRVSGGKDTLEDEIFGTWDGAGAGAGGNVEGRLWAEDVSKVGKYGAVWAGTGDEKGRRGDVTANEGFVRWERDIPVSKVVQHVPGAFCSVL